MLPSFMKLFRGKPADRTIWTADITYWIAGRKEAGHADPAWDTEEGYLQLHRDLGIMPYYYYEKFWTASPQYSGNIAVSHETQGNQSLNRIQTPLGALTEINTYLPSSSCMGCTKHYVESEQDLDVLLYVLEHRRLEPANLKDYSDRLFIWKQYDGLPCLGLPRSPLSAMVYEWAGIEQTTYLLLDCEEKISEALQLMENQEEPILDAVCELAPPLVHFPDNLSSDNLAGYYDAYMAGTHARRLARLHAAGVKCAIHLDGTVRGLLSKLIETGFDAVEALTPAPAGDLDMEEIREIAGNDPVILWGGVPGVMFAPPYTWREMETHVQSLLVCWGNRPFVMGVADQVPPDGDIRFCRRIAEMLT
ncbi:MAG: hypothetical protein KAJ05_01725 [Candidatus Latescibacteria bacterium]|nr:hypothetical protein [Candidatus Latescibacterota bacterium]MCK5525839.1 hypothetical protein [Candidatus Latescibacterota bacterium]